MALPVLFSYFIFLHIIHIFYLFSLLLSSMRARCLSPKCLQQCLALFYPLSLNTAFQSPFGFLDVEQISLVSALILISFLSISLGLIYSSDFLK